MAEENPAKTSAAASADAVTALLLRAIATEVAQRISPELSSADAIERATFTRLIVENLAADIDVLPALAAPLVGPLRDGIRDAIVQARRRESDVVLTAFAAELATVTGGEAASLRFELALLRDLAARVLRHLADSGREGTAALVAALGTCDARWVMDYDATCKARSAPHATTNGAAAADAQPGAAAEQVTTDNVTRYLRRRFPAAANICATAVIPIPGGRSKKTFFLSIAGSNELPSEMVIRQDYALKYAGTLVAHEYRPLVTLSKLGLPVPRPLHLESQISELGPSFMLMDRLSGKPPGSYFGMHTPCPGAFRELAAMLAKLHQVPPASLGLNAAPAGDRLQSLIEQYQSKWRDNATRASPVVDYAYAWALRECARDGGSSSFVHGDAGPYNLLVEDDRLKAMLDWEFAHVGDPAEDLGVARLYAETCMPWEEFMQIYLAAGGQPVTQSRIQLGMLTQFLKGTTLVAASGRNFIEGGTTEFIKGANAFTGLRLIELRIAELLKRFGAV